MYSNYVEFFYNRKRLHSALGDLSPVSYRPKNCKNRLACAQIEIESVGQKRSTVSNRLQGTG